MFCFLLLILLNGVCHCSLGYITTDGDQTTSQADEPRCSRMYVDVCFMCKDRVKLGTFDETVNVTVCYTRSFGWRTVTVADILRKAPENTTHLKVDVDNTWKGVLPFEAYPIDLNPITRLKELVYFNLYQRRDVYLQLYPVYFSKETFAGLTKLRVVALSIPIKDQSLHDLLSPLDSVQNLFLQPRAISMKNMSNTIAGLHHNTEHTLETLHLSNFQLLGMDGYNSTLNLTSFLHNRIFRCVKKLYLKGNSLAKLLPGLPVHFPNIEYIDISYNLLIDVTNTLSFLEIATHNTVVNINFEHQGYVGGSHHTTDSNFPQPHQTYYKAFDDSQILGPNSIFMIHCLNGQDGRHGTANISNFFFNKIVRKNFVECLSGRPMDFLIDYLTPLEDYIDTNCILFLQIPIGPRVEYIGYSHVHHEESTFKGFVFSGNLCIKKPNNLKTIDMAGNHGWMPMSKLAETLKYLTINGLDLVEKLIFYDNFLKINASRVFTKQNFPSLKHLYLGNNSVRIDANYGFCTHNKLLTHLNLQGNDLGQTADFKKFVTNCNNLKYLTLHSNNLSHQHLAHLNLTGTESLILLDLSKNNIEYLPGPFRHQIDQRVKSQSQMLTIDLTDNNLACDCRPETMIFVKWMIDMRNLLRFKHLNKITCTGKHGIRGIDTINERIIKQWQFECHRFYILIYIIPSVVLSILLTTCSFCCFKRRYVIGYKIFKLKQFLNRCCNDNSEEGINWTYDVFISYCAEDRFWVHSVLMKTLEEEYGFKLCIHYRDFPVGELIVDAIIDKMNQSQYIIVVISDLSLQSEWCQFELAQAMHQVSQFNKTLIAIQLGELKEIHENLTAGHIIQSHVALHWNEKNPKAAAYFWKRLVSCLYSDAEGQCRVCCGSCKKSIPYNEIYDMNDD